MFIGGRATGTPQHAWWMSSAWSTVAVQPVAAQEYGMMSAIERLDGWCLTACKWRDAVCAILHGL
jgi:hypothetical protein